MTEKNKHLFGIDKLNVKRSSIPAVTHVDYSARIQTVHKETNPKYEGLVIHSFSLAEPTPVYIGVSRKVSLTVRTKLKEAYGRLEKDGVLTRILDKWSK